MSYLPNQLANAGVFVQQSPIFDVGELQDVDLNSENFRELLVRLYQQMTNISIVLNLKTSGYYTNTEFVTSELYFAPDNNPANMRSIFMMTVDTGVINPGLNPGIPHGLTIASTWRFISIYGAANNTSTNNYYSLPYAAAAGIEVRLNATDIVIDNSTGLTFLESEIILKYIKT
jgi:hypothetical protein